MAKGKITKDKREFTDELRSKVLEDIENGDKWTDVAKKYGLDYTDVQSIFHKERVRLEAEQKEKGGQEVWINGSRISDGKPSPVKVFHISELQK